MVAGLLSSQVAFGVTLLDEDFSDGNRNGWYSTNTSTSAVGNDVVNSAAFSSGKAVRFYGGSGNNALVSSFSGVTLASSGDYLEFSASFYYPSNPVASNATTGPVLALYNNDGSAFASDEIGTAYGTIVENWEGYKATKFALGDTNDIRIYSQDPVEDTRSFIYYYTGSSLGSDSTGFQIARSEVYSATLRIELQENLTDVDLSYVISGNGSSYTYLIEDVAASTLAFNQVAMAGFSGQNAKEALVSDISVTSNIPEPGVAALIIAGGALGLVMVRRRRSSSPLQD